MAELDKAKPVSLEELMLANLAPTDGLTKLLLEKGFITEAEFERKLLEERAVYQRILNPTTRNNRGIRQCQMTLSSHSPVRV